MSDTDTTTVSDERAERIAAATKEADSGSNHGAGMDGDGDSAADKAHADRDQPNT